MVILMCGKICSGKSTYAEKLRKEIGAVVLSVDEIMLAMFGQNVGEMHDKYVERLEKLLFKKAADIAETGTNVILDLGLWTAAERKAAVRFYKDRGIKCELHYIDIGDSLWRERIDKRNNEILAGEVSAYYVDEGLAAKFGAIFEPPARGEADVWIEQ